MIKKLHHNAYRCRDSEVTRKFYEEFLGLRLAGTLEITETKTGRQTNALHTFYELGDGSYLAFFEVHIALEVERPMLEKKLAEGKARGIESRGIADHHFINSIYFRDPNGYVIELTAKMPTHAKEMDPGKNGAREKLDKWQAAKKQHASA
jgi:catechol 2,3-dioxygenase-like lactoylglutathione lyase family enzyme